MLILVINSNKFRCKLKAKDVVIQMLGRKISLIQR